MPEDPEELNVEALDRFRHIYIPGQTQYGKSTLMANQAYDDIKFERGVCVMDSKGDLIRQILDAIPAHRVKDVIYFGQEHPLPIDILRYQTHFERDLVIRELTQALLRKVNEDDAPEMGGNIRNVLRTIFDYNEHQKDPKERATLLDIHYFLTNEKRRNKIKAGLTNPDLIEHWNEPKNIPTGQQLHRIKLRTDDYIYSPFLRRVFDVPNPIVNIDWIINDRKILLINLLPMSDQMLLYATMILSQIRQFVNRRGDTPPSEQIPFFLYCDEFHEYQTTDFPTFLGKAGGNGLCLTLANQWVSQLTSEVRDAVPYSASTYFLFNMDMGNAIHLRGRFPKPEPTDKKNLTKFRKYAERVVAINDELSFLHEQYEKGGVDLLNEATNPIKVDRLIHERDLIKKRMFALPEDPPEPIDYLAMCPDLQQGYAIYRDPRGNKCKLNTPQPLGKRTNYAEDIKKRTLLPYPEGYACETVNRVYDESKPSVAILSDDIPPQPKTAVPPNPHKKTGTRTPR